MTDPNWKSSYLAVVCMSFALFVSARAQLPSTSDTGWNNGKFHVDVAAVISRSDIVLDAPNTQAREAMPLGNGSQALLSGLRTDLLHS